MVRTSAITAGAQAPADPGSRPAIPIVSASPNAPLHTPAAADVTQMSIEYTVEGYLAAGAPALVLVLGSDGKALDGAAQALYNKLPKTAAHTVVVQAGASGARPRPRSRSST